MEKRLVLLGMALGLLVSALACSNASTGPSETVNVAGNYIGPFDSADMGIDGADIALTLTQNGPTVTGNWHYTRGRLTGRTGTIIGTVGKDGFSGSMVATCNESTPTATVTGTISSEALTSLDSPAGFIGSTSGCIDGWFHAFLQRR